QALSYREAVLRAVDRLNEQSSEANLYRLLELDQPPKADEDPGTPKPVSFTVKETVCPRPTRQPPELCDFKENGQCVGTVTLNPSIHSLDISCNEVSGPIFFEVLLVGWCVEPPLSSHLLPHPGRERAPYPGPSLTWAPGLQDGFCHP
uniref:Peptide antibiotic PR39 n=1 Tax=Sus scrofa TaxID=9823 RepID=A0A8D0QHI0_PIG